MIPEELKDQAAAHALGLLDDRERTDFEVELDRNPELRRELEGYRSLATLLALSPEPVEPPAALRQRLLEKAAHIRPIRQPGSASTRRPIAVLLPWAIAACLAGAALLLFTRNLNLQEENRRLAARDPLNHIRAVALASASDDFPNVSAQVLWDLETGRGVLDRIKLPPPPAGKDYQLWVFEEGNPTPIPSRVFDPASSVVEFEPDNPAGPAATFAITIEDLGGRPSPEGPVVLVGSL